MSEFERVARAAAFLAERGGQGVELALILGSGLGAFAEQLEAPCAIPYAEIPEFPAPSVQGHRGRLVLGELGGVRVAALQGRVHLYEGYQVAEVVRPLRTLLELGARGLLVTNAAGSVHPALQPGDLMLISDHLNLTGHSPLSGELDPRWPSRFVDMTAAYDPVLTELLERTGREQGLALRRGVYAGLAGGAYETPAEVRMLHFMGADAVGMSTVLEVLTARHRNARVAGISCITNLGAGLGSQPLNHDEVQEVATRVSRQFTNLLRVAIPRLGHALR